MFKIQYRMTGEGDWADDERRFSTEAEAEAAANRMKLFVSVETQVVPGE